MAGFAADTTTSWFVKKKRAVAGEVLVCFNKWWSVRACARTSVQFLAILQLSVSVALTPLLLNSPQVSPK